MLLVTLVGNVLVKMLHEANRPTMRPRPWAAGVGWMAVMAVVVVTLGMIVCVHIVRFSGFMKRHNGP